MVRRSARNKRKRDDASLSGDGAASPEPEEDARPKRPKRKIKVPAKAKKGSKTKDVSDEGEASGGSASASPPPAKKGKIKVPKKAKRGAKKGAKKAAKKKAGTKRKTRATAATAATATADGTASGSGSADAPALPVKAAAAAASAAKPKPKASRFAAFLESNPDLVKEEKKPTVEEIKEEEAVSKDIPIDICFSFDTTGSMFRYLEEVKNELKGTITALFKELTNLRISIVAHGDFCDAQRSYVTQTLDFCGDGKKVNEFISSVGRTGGGDAPECYELVLRDSQLLSWRDDSSRALVLIGDDVPHEPSYTDQAIYWRDEVEALVDMGVKIYSVQCNKNERAAPFYEELAEISGGFLLHVEELGWMKHCFLGLVYRQHSLSLFENYRMGLIWEGIMTHESPINTMFFEMAAPVIQKMNPSYTAHERMPWWDPGFDDGTPRYTWNDDEEEWQPVGGVHSYGFGFGGAAAAATTKTKAKKKKKAPPTITSKKKKTSKAKAAAKKRTTRKRK